MPGRTGGFQPLEGLLVNRLSRQECEEIHDASLTVLARTGVELHDQEAIDLLKRAGADVSDSGRVRVPARLVEKALDTVPKELTLYNRAGKPVILGKGRRSYYGPGSDCLNIIDHRTGMRRRAVIRDVEEGAILCDGLENVDFVMSMFLPGDVDPLASDRYQMLAMLSHTAKPIIYVTNDFRGTVDAVEMAEVVAGGAEALANKPFVACYINVTTGLRHNEDALKKLMFLAGKNLPFTYAPVGQGGTTAPVTMAAGVVMVNAGALVGLVLSQLVREGSPFIMPGWSGEYLDMRTMVGHYVFPNHSGMAHSLAHYYGLPLFGIGGCTDSKSIDQQAGIEAALTLMSEMLGGATLVHDMGYLESGLTGSLVQLSICDETVRWLRRYSEPVEISEETLALDLIDQMGPDGQYLDSEHTLRHYRERWYSDLFDRRPYHTWQEDDSTSMADRAAKRVSQILAEHTPVPLPADVQEALRSVVHRAEERV